MSRSIPTIDAFHEKGRELLHVQMRCLDALIHEIAPPSDREIVEVDDDVRVIVWMLQAIGVSIDSVRKLTENRDMAIRDCFGIARSAAETAVNVSFIATGGQALADRAIKHMRQKRWRDLQRCSRIGKQTVSVTRKIDAALSDFPGLEDALAEFTNKKGGEIRDWTPESIEQRIAAVELACAQSGQLLAATIFTIYRPSSELLHGTFYGVNHFWQGSLEAPATSRTAFDRLWLSDHFATVLSSLIFASSGAIYAVAAARGLSTHSKDQEKVLGLMRGYAERLAETDPDDDHVFQSG